MPDPLGADIVQQQKPHLISGKEPVITGGIFYRNAHPVTVRVRGKKQIRVVFSGAFHAQSHGFPDFRVGIRAGGEMAVRLGLLRYHGNIGVAHFLQSPGHGHQPAAVEGGIDNGHVPVHLVSKEYRLPFYRLYKGGINLGGNILDGAGAQCRLKISPGDILKNIQLLNFSQDFPGSGGGDLAAVRAIDLVAVVFGRVVGGGDHHTGGSVQIPGGKGHRRHRHQLGPEEHLDPVGSEDLRRYPGKEVTFNATVIANGNGGGGVLLFQEIGQTLGGLGHGINIHPVGTGTDHTPEAPGAESQISIKSIFHPAFVHGPQLRKKVGISGGLFQPASVFLLYVHK